MSGKQVWMAIALSVVTATSGVTAAFDTKPDPLLALDMHRTAVIDRVVASFKEQMTADQEQRVRDTLYWMRADQLLAASLASSLDGLISVLESVDKSTPSKGARTKSAGDIDLAYTPITPCRIVDTRAGTSGRLIGGVEKTFAGYNSVSFATQGGSSSTCGIPIGAKALAMTVTAVRPDNLGFIKIWAANSSEPNASTINYDPGTTNIATGAIVPVDGANQNGFKAKSPAGVDLVVDVVGYFNAMKTAAPIDPAQLPLAYFDANDRPIGPWAKNASTDCSNTISCDLAIFRRRGCCSLCASHKCIREAPVGSLWRTCSISSFPLAPARRWSCRETISGSAQWVSLFRKILTVTFCYMSRLASSRRAQSTRLGSMECALVRLLK